MMIQDRWWNQFRLRSQHGKQTHSYVQRGAAPPKNTLKMLFYVAKPVGQLGGWADFIERRVGDPAQVWMEFGSESVLGSREKYDEFVKELEKVSFIRFRNLQEASKPMPLSDVLAFLGVRRLSRKGFYVNKETAEKLIALME